MKEREELLTSGESARLLGVTSEWVRQLERYGTLVPIARSARGMRLYCKRSVLELAAKRAEAKAAKAAKDGAR